MPVARSPGAIRLAVLTAAVLMAAAPAVRAGPQENAALFQAVKEGRLDAIRDLLRRGADANARNESGVTPLIMAAIVGGEPAARELLRAGADPNVQDHHEGTALGFAVGKESGPLVQALIEGGADPRRLKDGGAALLAEAASSRDGPQMVGALLAAGAQSPLFHDRAVLAAAVQAGNGGLLRTLLDPSARRLRPGQALYIAILAKDLPLVKALVHAGIPVDGETEHDGTPLLTALGMKAPETVRFLVDAGADVNREGHGDHTTPLVAAALHDCPLQTFELLLAHGANVNQVPPRPGTTALVAAAEYAKLDAVRLLVRHRADVNVMDASGVSPLARASLSGRNDVVSELLAHGARAAQKPGPVPERQPVVGAVETCNAKSLRALLAAGADPGPIPLRYVGSCPPEVAEVLAQSGFDLNRRDAAGDTALLGTVGGNRQTLLRLLELGADVNATGQGGETPLLRAATNGGRWEDARQFLEHGADVHARDASGRTALHRAAAALALRTIGLLAAAGADPEARDGKGRTPGDLYEAAVTWTPRTASREGSQISFSLPAEFRPCRPPTAPGAVFLECTADSYERYVFFDLQSLGQAVDPATFDLRSLAHGEGVTLTVMTGTGPRLPLVHYFPSVEDSEGIEDSKGISDPVRWMTLVPSAPEPLLIRVWTDRNHDLEMRWILQGVVRSLKEKRTFAERLTAAGSKTGRGQIFRLVPEVLGLALALAGAVLVIAGLLRHGRRRRGG